MIRPRGGEPEQEEPGEIRGHSLWECAARWRSKQDTLPAPQEKVGMRQLLRFLFLSG